MIEQVAHRPVDVYFHKYAESHQNLANKRIHWLCVPLIVFSLLGLVWAIPFPHLAFLGKYTRYVNWATFLILFSIIYYFLLSPNLAIAMLFVICVFGALIVTLEKLHNEQGWPEMWQVCLFIFFVSWVGQFIGHKIEGKKPSFLDDLRFLLIGPIWLWHFIFKKLGLPY
jgi:uncharacterized membrane protein YGL010W